MKDNKMLEKDPDRDVSMILGIFIIIFVVMFIVAIGVALWQFIFSQPVSLSAYTAPHLAMAGLFQPQYTNKPKRKSERKPYEQSTQNLFRGLILFIAIVAILSCIYTLTGG